MTPRHERVLDRLADALLDADEILQMLGDADAAPVRWIEPHMERVLDEINAAMRAMSS